MDAQSRNPGSLVERLFDAQRQIARLQALEDELRRSEEQFRGAFDYAAIGMALVAPEGRFLKVNRCLCDIVGYSDQELLARTFQDITHPDDLDADLSYVRQMLAGELRHYHMEKRYFHKDGHVVIVLLSVSLVHDSRGDPLYFISQIQDITARKRAEEERETLICQLQEALATVKTLRELLPICAWCNNVRNDQGYWKKLESYFADHLDVSFTHSICPDCLAKNLPENKRRIRDAQRKADPGT
jgi:PAS domain S-box-containing protein